jgi:DNA-directed RNA polymerase specialized sigma24 family protein
VLAPDTESAILALARSSAIVEQRAATDRLVSELSQPLYRLCLHLTGHAADAEDALQDTLIAACRALPQFRGEHLSA